jgi:uncharacterized protein (UPF0335 family)
MSDDPKAPKRPASSDAENQECNRWRKQNYRHRKKITFGEADRALFIDEPRDSIHAEAEIKELNEVKKEIYLEAKGNGYDVKTLREVIRIRKQDEKKRDEQESLLDTYLEAIREAKRVAKAA